MGTCTQKHTPRYRVGISVPSLLLTPPMHFPCHLSACLSASVCLKCSATHAQSCLVSSRKGMQCTEVMLLHSQLHVAGESVCRWCRQLSLWGAYEWEKMGGTVVGGRKVRGGAGGGQTGKGCQLLAGKWLEIFRVVQTNIEINIHRNKPAAYRVTLFSHILKSRR